MKNSLVRTKDMLDKTLELLTQPDGVNLALLCVLSDIAVSLSVIADTLTKDGTKEDET